MFMMLETLQNLRIGSGLAQAEVKYVCLCSASTNNILTEQ